MRKTKTAATVIRTETREADGASYVYRLIMRESEALSSYRLPLYSVEIEFCGADGVRRMIYETDRCVDHACRIGSFPDGLHDLRSLL